MHIGILAFPDFQLLDVSGLADVFAEAARQLGDPRAYSVQVIGTEPGMLRSSCDATPAPDAWATRGSRPPGFTLNVKIYTNLKNETNIRDTSSSVPSGDAHLTLSVR
ncbi:hypothetical protein GCM10023165_49450 [Variovorax defluvii]|uniref:GlxA family transcriptional regulator n=1 Tax=Variovorax defluvii TaxID=913761 RepID=A0ABP8IDC8_9BURK